MIVTLISCLSLFLHKYEFFKEMQTMFFTAKYLSITHEWVTIDSLVNNEALREGSAKGSKKHEVIHYSST